MTVLARRERLALCDLVAELGPDQPTLCGEWTTLDLLAHLVVREHSLLGGAGIAVPPLAPLTEKAMSRARERGFETLLARVRRPGLTPFVLPGVEVLSNTMEFVVHHEDVRRAQPDWSPRHLDAADLDRIWSMTRIVGRGLVRPAGVPVVVRRSDTGATGRLRGGDDPVTITGPPLEVALFLYGRHQVRDLTFEGPDASVAKVRGADLGM